MLDSGGGGGGGREKFATHFIIFGLPMTPPPQSVGTNILSFPLSLSLSPLPAAAAAAFGVKFMSSPAAEMLGSILSRLARSLQVGV